MLYSDRMTELTSVMPCEEYVANSFLQFSKTIKSFPAPVLLGHL